MRKEEAEKSTKVDYYGNQIEIDESRSFRQVSLLLLLLLSSWSARVVILATQAKTQNCIGRWLRCISSCRISSWPRIGLVDIASRSAKDFGTPGQRSARLTVWASPFWAAANRKQVSNAIVWNKETPFVLRVTQCTFVLVPLLFLSGPACFLPLFAHFPFSSYAFRSLCSQHRKSGQSQRQGGALRTC